jgi:hypothetical protein
MMARMTDSRRDVQLKSTPWTIEQTQYSHLSQSIKSNQFSGSNKSTSTVNSGLKPKLSKQECDVLL